MNINVIFDDLTLYRSLCRPVVRVSTGTRVFGDESSLMDSITRTRESTLITKMLLRHFALCLRQHKMKNYD